MLEITPRSIEKYSEKLSSDLSELLIELERATHLKTLSPGMLCGKLTSNFLQFITAVSGSKFILEIGTFTGYSALTFAQAIPADGKVFTIESNPQILSIAHEFFNKSGLEDKIKSFTGRAEEIIPTINQEFDLIFIDGSKQDYQQHYELCLDKLRSGGILMADNVLWYGEVVEPKLRPKARAIDAFNQYVKKDKRVENILIPFGDGVNCIIKL